MDARRAAPARNNHDPAFRAVVVLIRESTEREVSSLSEMQSLGTDCIEAGFQGMLFRRWLNEGGGLGGFVRVGTDIDPTAFIDEKAVVNGGSVGAGAVLSSMSVSVDAEIGDGVVLEEYAVAFSCTIGNYSRIGEHSVVKARAEVGEFKIIGPDTVVYGSEYGDEGEDEDDGWYPA